MPSDYVTAFALSFFAFFSALPLDPHKHTHTHPHTPSLHNTYLHPPIHTQLRLVTPSPTPPTNRQTMLVACLHDASHAASQPARFRLSGPQGGEKREKAEAKEEAVSYRLPSRKEGTSAADCAPSFGAPLACVSSTPPFFLFLLTYFSQIKKMPLSSTTDGLGNYG